MCDKSPIYKSIYPLVKEFWERRENNLVGEMQRIKLTDRSPGMSAKDKEIAERGDEHQAKKLLEAKYKGKSGY